MNLLFYEIEKLFSHCHMHKSTELSCIKSMQNIYEHIDEGKGVATLLLFKPIAAFCIGHINRVKALET